MKTEDAYTQVRTAFGRRVRQLRESQGLSQKTFALMVGLDRSYLSQVENGKRNISIDNLVRIAVGLDVTLSHLVDEIDVSAVAEADGAPSERLAAAQA